MNDKQVEQQIDEALGSIKEEQSWLLTYADMMTLLFAFFVLLFSLSTIDPVKISQLQDGMGDQPELKSFNEITEDFKEIISSDILGYLVFNDLPAKSTVLGVSIIVACGVYLFHRERIASKQGR